MQIASDLLHSQTHFVVDHLGHADGAAREVRIEVLAVAQHHSRWRLCVAGQQGEDVVLAAVTRRRNVAQVWRIGAVVGRTRSLLVRVRTGEVVRQLAGPFKVVALVVGTVLDLFIIIEGLNADTVDMHMKI